MGHGARNTDDKAVEHKYKISGYFIFVSESRDMAPDPFAINRGSRGYRDGGDAISHLSMYTRESPIKPYSGTLTDVLVRMLHACLGRCGRFHIPFHSI